MDERENESMVFGQKPPEMLATFRLTPLLGNHVGVGKGLVYLVIQFVPVGVHLNGGVFRCPVWWCWFERGPLSF